VKFRVAIVPLLAAVVSVAAASAGARHALAADQPAPAEQTYFDTLAVMHAIPNAPFLRFDYHFAQVASGIPDHQEDWHVVERTEDGRASLKDDRGKERAEGGAERGRPFFYVRPDLFLKPPVAASPHQFGIVTDTPYKVIGSTRTATHYVITDASAETTADCPGATHLRLRPKAGADPFYYNLRELWIAPASSRICKVNAVWYAGNYMGHRFSVTFTLDVAADTGLIDRWSAAGVARNGPFHSSYHADGHYADVKRESSEPAGLFDRAE
jgi:hypothetical protein